MKRCHICRAALNAGFHFFQPRAIRCDPLRRHALRIEQVFWDVIRACDGLAVDLDRIAGIVSGRCGDGFAHGHFHRADGEGLPQTELLPDHFDGHVFGLNILRRPSHGADAIAADRP